MEFCTILFTKQLKRRKSSSPREHRAAQSLPEKTAVAAPGVCALAPVAGSVPHGVRGSGPRASGSPLPSSSGRCVPKTREGHSCVSAVTKSGGNFSLTNLFQNAVGFFLVCLFALRLLPSSLLGERILRFRVNRF